jgi:hypothetical protein
MGRAGLANRRGWSGPKLFGPEALLARIQKKLREEDAERAKRNARRTRNGAKVVIMDQAPESDLFGTKQAQKPSGPEEWVAPAKAAQGGAR